MTQTKAPLQLPGKPDKDPGTSMRHSDSATTVSTTEMSPRSPEDKYKQYWECALKKFGTTSNDGMLLSCAASTTDIASKDGAEVMHLLSTALKAPSELRPEPCDEVPQVDRIIEIGAGNGRLTKKLQKISREVYAVDFMNEYVEKNRASNQQADRPNDRFMAADARRLQFEDQTMDVVFWNWLLSYFDDAEVETFIPKVMRWVKVGGFLFCRESCGEPSHQSKREWATTGNPTQYRQQEFYTKLFEKAALTGGKATRSEADPNEPVFEILVSARPVAAYVEQHSTCGQCCWLLRRVS